ncbi:MAG: hypothetical protein HYX56_01620, partial [Chloroflexi bacterium]|nr:hypothetical protein [Chloroflexota bacterium]
MKTSRKSAFPSRPTTTTRTKSPTSAGRLLAAALAAVVLFAACTSAPRPTEASDVVGAHEIARDAGDLLLRLSAYDYAIAGTLAGQRTYVVAPDRYASVVRASAANIQKLTGATLSVTLNAQGPVRDRLVALADGLVDVSRDANAYADGGDTALLARLVAGVAKGWEDLRALHRLLKPADDELAKTIDRGSSIAVTAAPARVWIVTVGPFATAGEADVAGQRIGTVEQVTRVAPFIVRAGTYADSAAADAAIASIRAKGFTGISTQEDRYTFARSGPAPDVELWREPERVFDTWGSARRVAVATNAAWLATGSDDGTIAIFTGEGTLRSLPKFNAGVAYLAFSDDNRWLFGGGQTLSSFILPQGVGIGSQLRLPSP